MTPFEYITVLISIILGLGITQIVTGIADIIHQWEKMKLYWPHVLWILLVFVMHIHEWWYTYELKKHESWHLAAFLFLISYPIMLFVLARILFPFGAMETETNFKDFYFNNYRKFFLVVSILVALAASHDFLLEGRSWQEQLPKLAIPVTLSIISLRKIRIEFLHKIIVLILLGVFIASLVLMENTIG